MFRIMSVIAKRKERARALARDRRPTMGADPISLIRYMPALESSAVIAGYWPIGSEIDTRPLLRRLSRSHKIVLPVTFQDRRLLSFREWTPDAKMEAGPFGTKHPVGQIADGADALVPNVVLVPLLAFTAQGDRLGYGGGFYDATLAALKEANPSTRAVGVAYAAQQVRQLPIEEFDMPLDAMLTEQGFRLFRA